MPRYMELMLMTMGALTSFFIVAACLISVVHLFCEWNKRRAERRAYVEQLIHDCRCPSKWIVPELRGRG